MPFSMNAGFAQDSEPIADGIPKDVPLRRVKLPEDELHHPRTMEWWYFKGHLVVGDDHRVSIFIAVLKQDFFLVPMSVALVRLTDHAAGPLPLLATARRFREAYSEKRPQCSFAFDYSFGDGALTRASSLSVTSATANEATCYRIRLQGQHDCDLTLTSVGRHVTLGSGGVVDYAGGARLAYWARPTLAVSGTSQLGGKALPVSGSAWMERQWGRASVADYAWSYFPVQLDDGHRFLFYRTVHLVKGDVGRHGLHIDPDGRTTELADLTFRAGERRLERDRRPLTLDWTITFRRPQELARELTISPLFDNQIVSAGIPKVPDFYEGISTVTDHRGQQIGWSMTELHNH